MPWHRSAACSRSTRRATNARSSTGRGDLLDRFAAVQLELSFVELYEGQQLYDELVQDLGIHGLELWALETGISDDTGRLLQCDGLFMRKAT